MVAGQHSRFQRSNSEIGAGQLPLPLTQQSGKTLVAPRLKPGVEVGSDVTLDPVSGRQPEYCADRREVAQSRCLIEARQSIQRIELL